MISGKVFSDEMDGEQMNKCGCGVPKLECPKCGELIISSVKDTQHHDGKIRRIRKCENCGARFVTVESICCIVKSRRKNNE